MENNKFQSRVQVRRKGLSLAVPHASLVCWKDNRFIPTVQRSQNHKKGRTTNSSNRDLFRLRVLGSLGHGDLEQALLERGLDFALLESGRYGDASRKGAVGSLLNLVARSFALGLLEVRGVAGDGEDVAGSYKVRNG